MKKSPVTIRDVAQLAGVSSGTVSKAMNNSPRVSEATRQRVLAAAEKLNFRPNNIARSLRQNRTATIGLITDDIEGVFTMSMMRGVEDAAQMDGYSVFLCNTYSEPARERAYLEMLLEKQVDGVIILSGYKVSERGAPAVDLGATPLIYLYQYTRALDIPCVLPNDYQGAVLATRHIVDLGYRRIGLIGGPLHYEAVLDRLRGYKDVLADAGISYDPSLVVHGKWKENAGYAMMRELLAQSQPPEAIFCMSDSLASGALFALAQTGHRVPHDIAVIGFDNRNFAAYKHPPLTTVNMPLYEMGRCAADLLLARIRQEETKTGFIRVDCELVVRESCGAHLGHEKAKSDGAQPTNK